MKKALHILTRPNDELAARVIGRQRAQPDAEILAVDLAATPPDYADLLEKIFAADSVAVW